MARLARLACSLDPGSSLDQAVTRVRLAESLGYESVWTTHIAAREPLQVLSLYGQHTERIGLATGVVPIFLRHPALLAMEAATLDEASGGRLTLGIGVSHQITVEQWYGLTLDDPIGRMREYAAIVRALLRDGFSSFEGTHYTSRFGFLGFRPRPGLRMVFAALGPRMLRLAAELADGVVLWMCNPAYIREVARPAIERGLTEHGRSPDEFDIVATVPLALTEDVEAGREAVRRRIRPYTQLPFYRRVIAAGGHGEDLEALDRATAAGDPEADERGIPDSFVDDYAGLGDARALAAKLDEYRRAGVTLPSVGPVAGHDGALGVEATLEALAP